MIQADKLPSGVDYCVFDYAVNSGPSQAVKTLQRAINVTGGRNITVDGRIGNVTLEGASSAEPKALINEVCGERDTFFHSLKKLFPVFGKGWMARLGRVRERALKLASQAITSEGGLSAMTVAQVAPKASESIITPKELGGDAPKETKLPELVTGISGVAATGLVAVVNNPYALTFALVVFLAGAFFVYRKYRNVL